MVTATVTLNCAIRMSVLTLHVQYNRVDKGPASSILQDCNISHITILF